MQLEKNGEGYPYDRDYGFDTLAVHGAQLFEPVTGALSTPIYQSSTFRHPGLNQSTGFDYSRVVNPTRLALEKAIALLEGGGCALAFASGMGAISAIIKLFRPGDHLVVSEDLYGGTWRLFSAYYEPCGYSFSWVDTSDPAKIRQAMRPETRGLFIETPSNPMMKVTDIAASAEIVHRQGGLLVVDNTFLSPFFQKPLALGADVVVHSGTKYLAGHNDTLAGLIVHHSPELEEVLALAHKSEGATLGPFDAWLVLRGLKTLPLRMERQDASARKIAFWLREHPLVEKVFYTGFDDHPQYALSRAQTTGDGGMISFYLRDAAHVPVLLRSVSLILFAESLGGVESLLTYPLTQTHQALPEAMRLSAGVNDRLMRLSVGIEDVDDLLADLDQALGRCTAEAGIAET